jgi:hypothetical protein
MKEHGMLMTPDNIAKSLGGQKIMTRRLLNPQPKIVFNSKVQFKPDGKTHGRMWSATTFDVDRPRTYRIKCPWQIGDHVYFKEPHYRFGKWIPNGETKTGRPAWRFVGTGEYLFERPDFARVESGNWRASGWYKRSPLFMPKKFARHWAEVTLVKPPERVQEISDHDAILEGLAMPECDATAGYVNGRPIKMFACLWDSIHSNPKGWAANPWVWPIGYKMIERD